MELQEKKERLDEAVDKIASRESQRFSDEKLRRMFQNCFVSTAKTTTKFLEDGEAFVFTGDIPALWLRDSSAQVVHYLKYLKEEPILGEMVRGLIRRQIRYICIDPYANAYNETDNGNCWEHDRTETNDWEWERKYEVDSLCYPVWLIHQYVEHTQDTSIFTEEVLAAFRRILGVWTLEQHHENSPYYFERDNCPASDTLPNEGKGTAPSISDRNRCWL